MHPTGNVLLNPLYDQTLHHPSGGHEIIQSDLADLKKTKTSLQILIGLRVSEHVQSTLPKSHPNSRELGGIHVFGKVGVLVRLFLNNSSRNRWFPNLPRRFDQSHSLQGSWYAYIFVWAICLEPIWPHFLGVDRHHFMDRTFQKRWVIWVLG